MNKTNRKRLHEILDQAMQDRINEYKGTPLPIGAIETYQELADYARIEQERTPPDIRVVKDMQVAPGSFLGTSYVPQTPRTWARVYLVRGNHGVEPYHYVFNAWVGFLDRHDIPHYITIWVEKPDDPMTVIPLWHKLAEISLVPNKRILDIWLFKSLDDIKLNWG